MTKSRCALFILCAAISVVAFATVQPGAAAPAVPPFNVTSTADAIDDALGDGFCHTSISSAGAGLCTLRAAVMEASHTSGVGATISVPPASTR